MGAVKANFWYAFLAASTLVFGAAYTLWMYKRVIFGAVTNDHVAHLHDITLARKIYIPPSWRSLCWLCGLYPLRSARYLHVSG